MSAAQWHENNNEACRSDATPAQVTEAHRELARRIMFEFTQAGTATASDVRMAAQLIADSEARACDQLRAEVERLRDGGVQRIKDAMAVVMDERDSFKARAERAEAELHALRLVCGTTDADRFSTWVDRANARADKAEAELAKAKAVLASIEEDGTEEHNAAVRLRQELAAERQKVRALTAILESICEEWGRNHDTNPIGAGQRMETMASKALEKLEDEA